MDWNRAMGPQGARARFQWPGQHRVRWADANDAPARLETVFRSRVGDGGKNETSDCCFFVGSGLGPTSWPRSPQAATLLVSQRTHQVVAAGTRSSMLSLSTLTSANSQDER